MNKTKKAIKSLVSRFRALTLRCFKKLKRLTPKQIGLGVGVIALLVAAFYIIAFFWPQTVNFSYSGQNCFFNPVLFPQAVRSTSSQSFNSGFKDTITVAGFVIYSPTTCVTMANAPKPDSDETLALKPLGSFLQKTVRIKTGQMPNVESLAKKDRPVSVKEPLYFDLNQPDNVFVYELKVNKQNLECQKNHRQLACDLNKIKLKQSVKYTFSLHRKFNQRSVNKVFEEKLATVSPIKIVKTSIKPGITVYDKPKHITLTLSKHISSFEGLKLSYKKDSKWQDLAVSAKHKGSKITIALKKSMPRQVNFRLQIKEINAKDNGYLTKPYTQGFKTSGGPKVSSSNINNYRTQPGTVFSLGFDYEIKAGQNLNKFIRVEVGGKPVASTVTSGGNAVSITPNTPLGACTPFTVRVLSGLQNKHGVSGGGAWQTSSRILCQSTFSIGASVQGRGIIGYSFGSGPSLIAYVGTLHGDETSATYTLKSWVQFLESNAPNIPGHRKIVVIPVLNPDGFAANKRTNAHNIDLNRNFPANNWKSGVRMPDGSYLKHGGGKTPLSESESAAIASYMASARPRLVLSYHAVGPLAAANEAGDSLGIAKTYGQTVDFPYYGNEAESNFPYDTTGAFEDWMRDKLGIPGILIELSSKNSNEFNSQKDAMWNLVTLP